MTTPQQFAIWAAEFEEEKTRQAAGLLPQAATPSPGVVVGARLGAPTTTLSSDPFEQWAAEFEEKQRQRNILPPSGADQRPSAPIPEPAPSLAAAASLPERTAEVPTRTAVPERKPDRGGGIGAFAKKAAGRAYEQTGLKGTVGALDWLQRNVSEPIGATANVVQLPGPEIPYISRGGGFEFNPEQLPWRPDWRERYHENVPIGGRIATEMILDPLNLVPGIGFTKMAQVRRFGGRLGLRQPGKAGEIERLTEEALTASILKEGAAPSPQVDAIQAGMDIGEPPSQGTLGLAGQEGISRPLIDAEQVAERQRLAAERAAGQAELSPGAPQAVVTPPSGVPSPVPSPAAAAPPPGQPPTPPTSLLNPRVPPEKDPVIQKALRVLRGIKRVSKREQAAMFAAERKARFARGMGASEGLPIREGFPRFFGAQAGEFPRSDIEPIVGQFTEDEVNHLFRRIEAPGVLRVGYDRNNAAAALADLLHPSTAKIPMPRDLALLERAFGADFARTLYNKKRTASQAVWDEFIAAWNLPRSLVASLDLSATLRQGAILAPGNLTDWRASVVAELKALRSETYAAKAWDDIYLHQNYERLINAGLDLTQRGALAPLLKREEAFMSRWAGRIPGVRASERAYVTMLNKLRFDVANKMLDDLVGKGLSEGELEKQLVGAMDFINWTTGRGPTIPGGRVGESLQALLNGVMFSPRFMTSRFATLTLPLTAYQNPAIRMKLAKDLVAWVGVTTMVVGLAKAAGARVETDPRSGEFGKIVFGHTRYDPWAGMQPTGRFIAQLMWAQGKSSLGKVYSTDDEDLISKRQRLKSEGKMSDEEFAKSGRFVPARMNLLKRFLRSKLQPLAGEAWDQATGEDWLGGEATPGQALSKDPRVNLFVQNLLPILAQDTMEAVVNRERPTDIVGAAAASAVGVGASTYQSALDIGQEEFPGLSVEELRKKPEATRKRWQKEADRRRGMLPKKKPTSKEGRSNPPIRTPVGIGASPNLLR